MAVQSEVVAPAAAPVQDIVTSVEVAENMGNVSTMTDATTPVASEAMMQKNWYEIVSSYFEGYPAWAVEVAVFGVGALVLGFLCKTVGRYLFFAGVAAALLLVVLSHMQVVSINMMQVKQFLGIQDIASLQDLGTVLVEWGKVHVIAVVSLIFGFILGWKLG